MSWGLGGSTRVPADFDAFRNHRISFCRISDDGPTNFQGSGSYFSFLFISLLYLIWTGASCLCSSRPTPDSSAVLCFTCVSLSFCVCALASLFQMSQFPASLPPCGSHPLFSSGSVLTSWTDFQGLTCVSSGPEDRRWSPRGGGACGICVWTGTPAGLQGADSLILIQLPAAGRVSLRYAEQLLCLRGQKLRMEPLTGESPAAVL